MSQVKFKSKYKGEDVEVITGWDPPLGYYYLEIFNTNNNVVFNGFFQLGFCRELYKLSDLIKELGIKIPPDTLEIVFRREGNVKYTRGDVWERNVI